MNSQGGSLIEQGLLQFFGKEPDAAAFLQRPTQTFVDLSREFELCKIILRSLFSQPREYQFRLLQCERAFASGNLY